MHPSGRRSNPAVVILVASLSLCSQHARAQPDQATSLPGTPEQIVVTARRRAENLQQLAVSVTALTAGDLRERMVFDVDEADEYIPNVTMTTPGSEVAQIVIRGIGGNIDPRIPNGTSLYLDGVLIPSTFGAFMSTLDIERIEVLRGPQGAMMGKNTTGGAVNVITRRPGPDYEAGVTLRLGELGQRDLRLSFNAPVVDASLFTRVAVALERDDGYYREITTGKGYQDRDLRGLQSSWRWLVNENWTLDLSGRYASQQRSNRGGECNFLERTRNNSERHESGGGGDYETACNASKDTGNYRFISDIDGFTDITQINLAGVATWNSQGPVGKLGDVSMTISAGLGDRTFRQLGDRDLSGERLFSIGSFGYPAGAALGTETEVTSFQALFQSEAIDGRLELTLGYDYVEDRESPEGQDCAALYTSVRGSGQSVTCSRPGGTYLDLIPLNITGIGPSPEGSQVFFRNESHAVFLNGSWDLSERVFIDFGGRWMTEKREFTEIVWSPANVLAGRDQIMNELSDATVSQFENGADRWAAFTPMISVSRRLATPSPRAIDEGIVYLSYSEGFNSGGFNYGLPARILRDFYEYGTEQASAWEAGIKSTWRNGRLRLNAAAFLTDYTDKQVEIVAELGEDLFPEDPFIGFIDNVADVEIYGVELEAAFRSDTGFSLDVALASLENRFTEYRSFDPELGISLDLKNLGIDDRTPDYTLSAIGRYDFALAGGSTLTPQLGVYWQDDDDFGVVNRSPADCFQPAYSRWHARLTWENLDHDRQLALFGRNIDDEVIVHACINSGITAQRVQLEAPARWGIEFSMAF